MDYVKRVKRMSASRFLAEMPDEKHGSGGIASKIQIKPIRPSQSNEKSDQPKRPIGFRTQGR